MAFMLTRIRVSDYDEWKAMFDSDPPRAREHASGYRLLRGVEDPNEVFIQVEFPTEEKALEARERLSASGVLNRLEEHTGPTLATEAEAVTLAG